MGWNFSFRPYVPVAKRRNQALLKIEKLKKKGLSVEPVKIIGRKIATTFWGKAWCEHIESFNDYENRLSRGRTYARNGSICHLNIEKGLITGIVSGSEIYNIKVNIKTLEKTRWDHIKKICLGKINSLLDLISGKLSGGVMEVVCDRINGIFPLLKDINLSCDCPDIAKMCKHIAAILYGVGSRLDLQPEQLFKLRGVNHEELVDLKTAIDDVTKSKETKYRHIIDPKLSKIFDIDLAGDEIDPIVMNDKKNNNISKVIKKHKEKTKLLQTAFTGLDVSKLRKKLKLNCALFAKKLGISKTTILAWESKGKNKLTLKEKSLNALNKVLLVQNKKLKHLKSKK